jgi:hypothetical protein
MKKATLLIFSIILLTASTYAQKTTYPVIVSFNSMCCGVPDNAPVMNLIKSFKKQHHIKYISVDNIGPMGREGEYYLAFRLKEMSKTQKAKFIAALKKIAPAMKDKGSAEVRENEVVDKGEIGRAVISTKKL